MFIQLNLTNLSKTCFQLGAMLRTKRVVLLTGLLATLMLFQMTSSPIAWAANSLQDAGFESASLNYGWHKWGYPRSTVGVTSADHTPNGAWSGYIFPNGRYVEIQQNLGVAWGNQYHLQAWVQTNGMTAQLGWWSTADGTHNCGNPVTSTTWVKVSCNFTPSASTDFNVHLGGNSPSGTAFVDDVQLFKVADGGGYNQLNVDLRHDLNPIITARDYKTSIWVNTIPNNYTGNRNVSDWLALRTPRWFQVGFMATTSGVQWFVETVDEGLGHLVVTCPPPGIPDDQHQKCFGGWGNRAGQGRWQDVELVTYGQGFWVIRVYDQFGQALDVATINDTSLTITDAFNSGEESWNWDNNNPDTQEDQYLHMEFYNFHPKYMVWGPGFKDWDGGGSVFSVYPLNYTICPAPYGALRNLNGDNRFWFVGSGGGDCSANPIF